MEKDESPFGWPARAGLILLGLVLAAAGLFAGFHSVAIVVGALTDHPVQPLPIYGVGLAMLAFPALLLALGFRCLTSRHKGELKLAAIFAGAALADALLAVWLVRLPTGGCVANPPVVRGAIEATGCIDRSWSPPS